MSISEKFNWLTWFAKQTKITVLGNSFNEGTKELHDIRMKYANKILKIHPNDEEQIKKHFTISKKLYHLDYRNVGKNYINLIKKWRELSEVNND